MVARTLIVVLLALALPAAGEEPAPRVALVLGGGGARGAAHIGVLRVLERERVPVELIVGTSMGAVVGGLYASGLSVAEIESLVEAIDWEAAFDDAPPRKQLPFRRKVDDQRAFIEVEAGFNQGRLTVPTGMIAGQKLSFILQSSLLHTFGVDDFDDLPIAFRAVATDLNTGRQAVLGEGSLPEAIRASMSVPLIFASVEIDGRTLIDGGIVNNLPVDVARERGLEHLIAVDVGTPLGALDETPSLFSVATRTIDVLTFENVRESRASLASGDLLITPEIPISSTEFGRFAEAIAAGEQAAQAAVEELRAYALEPDAYAAWRSGLQGRLDIDPTTVRIDELAVEGLERVAPQQVLRRISTRPGDLLDLARIAEDLERIYRIGEFELVGFRLEPDGERNRLIIEVDEKSWGPGFVRLGINLQANLEGSGFFRAFGDYTRTQLNDLGAEWKTIGSIGDLDGIFSELYQPLDYGGNFFLVPSISWAQTEESIATADAGIVPARLAEYGIELATGAQLSNVGELRLGARRRQLRIVPRQEIAPTETIDIGGLFGRVNFDRLDDPFFPREGWFGASELFLSRDGYSADVEYDRFEAEWGVVLGAGKGAFLGTGQFGSSLGSDLPFFEEFTLGGFLDQTGLDPGSLSGDYKLALELVYYREVARLPRLFGSEIYLGGAVELGNVWETEESVDYDDMRLTASLIAGFRSLVGPLYVALGMTEEGDAGFYLFLGNPFN